MAIKDTIKKYFTTTTLVVGLVILSLGGVYIAVNQHSKLTAARSELASSKVLNTIVEAEKSRLDGMIVIYKDSLVKRDGTIIAKDKKIKEQQVEVKSLREDLGKVLIDVSKISADSSFRYINQRVMPKAERKYPFDSVQVKAIHYAFVERDGLFNINNKLTVTVSDLKQLSFLKDSQIADLNSLVGVYVSKEGICKKENDAYKIEITGLNKTVKQQKFLKNILLPPAAVGVAAIIIKILAK
jgi:hypothetical protein